MPGRVFFPAWGEDPATLIKCGQQLRELGWEVVVKIVATRAGATASAALAAEAPCMPTWAGSAASTTRPAWSHSWNEVGHLGWL